MFSGELPPERFNLARYCLNASASTSPEKTALIVAGAETLKVSFGAMEEQVLRVAGGLRRTGLARGDRVLIHMASGLDYALAFFGTNAAGGVPVPASPLLTESEVAMLEQDSGARFVLRDLAVLKAGPLGAYEDTSANDPAYLVYTSGTSGKPKGVLHAQRAVWGRRPMHQGWYGLTRDDIMLHTGALNWTYAMGTALMDPWSVGATAVISTGGRDMTVWARLIADHGVTIFASVPGVYRKLLRAGFKPPISLRHGLTAGEALTPALHAAFVSATGRPLYEAFGMSEISTYISSSPTTPTRPGSPGKPQTGRALRIGDDGALMVHRSDPGLMLGYWNTPAETAEWFTGGDLGRFDSDGYFWHGGRSDDVMNAMGYRVSPLDVEAALEAHPAVAEAGVTEIAVREGVSIIAAFVVLVEGQVVDERTLVNFAGERLASYKLPKVVRFVRYLTRTANGKLARKRLKELF